MQVFSEKKVKKVVISVKMSSDCNKKNIDNLI